MAGRITLHGSEIFENGVSIGRFEYDNGSYIFYYTAGQSDGHGLRFYSIVASPTNIERRLDTVAMAKAIDDIRTALRH